MDRKFSPGDLVVVIDPEHPFRQETAVVEADPPMPLLTDKERVNLVAGRNSFSVKEHQIRLATEEECKRYRNPR